MTLFVRKSWMWMILRPLPAFWLFPFCSNCRTLLVFNHFYTTAWFHSDLLPDQLDIIVLIGETINFRVLLFRIFRHGKWEVRNKMRIFSMFRKWKNGKWIWKDTFPSGFLNFSVKKTILRINRNSLKLVS